MNTAPIPYPLLLLNQILDAFMRMGYYALRGIIFSVLMLADNDPMGQVQLYGLISAVYYLISPLLGLCTDLLLGARNSMWLGALLASLGCLMIGEGAGGSRMILQTGLILFSAGHALSRIGHQTYTLQLLRHHRTRFAWGQALLEITVAVGILIAAVLVQRFDPDMPGQAAYLHPIIWGCGLVCLFVAVSIVVLLSLQVLPGIPAIQRTVSLNRMISVPPGILIIGLIALVGYSLLFFPSAAVSNVLMSMILILFSVVAMVHFIVRDTQSMLPITGATVLMGGATLIYWLLYNLCQDQIQLNEEVLSYPARHQISLYTGLTAAAIGFTAMLLLRRFTPVIGMGMMASGLVLVPLTALLGISQDPGGMLVTFIVMDLILNLSESSFRIGMAGMLFPALPVRVYGTLFGFMNGIFYLTVGTLSGRIYTESMLPVSFKFFFYLVLGLGMIAGGFFLLRMNPPVPDPEVLQESTPVQDAPPDFFT